MLYSAATLSWIVSCSAITRVDEYAIEGYLDIKRFLSEDEFNLKLSLLRSDSDVSATS